MKQRIVEEISQSGPIPFERFMELALYDPTGGFFATGPLRSEKAGDFLTSPEISPMFGATIARFVESEYERLGEPRDFTVVEVGAGSGSLLGPLLESLPFAPRVIAVEASPAARSALTDRLSVVQVQGPDAALPSGFQGVVLANELLDNLPMALAVRDGGGWAERWVTSVDNDLALTEVSVRPEIRAWLEAYGGPVDDGGIVEAQIAATDWLRSAASSLAAGAIVAFDYGDVAEELAPRRATGTLRTYRAHHLGPHPLEEPGATDITADVNFSAMLGVGEQCGLDCDLFRQDDFLGQYGLRKQLATLRQRELDLARSDDAMARLAVRSEVKEIETLLHPRGLGDFRVFVGRTRA